ncbi:OmpH family outer membrane protein [Candidatus Pandoraea novymonadis]|nr:OmpH family outer membrane protein [Candidatus Pandoraea novymonadis]
MRGLAIILLNCATFSTWGQEARIAAVNSDKILRESLPAKAAQSKLEIEFSKRDHDLQNIAANLKSKSNDIDKKFTGISDAENFRRQKELDTLNTEFQRKQREFREELNQRRNQELAVVLERANKVIKQIAETEKYDLIVQEAVYVNPRIDITDKVLKKLNSDGAK